MNETPQMNEDSTAVPLNTAIMIVRASDITGEATDLIQTYSCPISKLTEAERLGYKAVFLKDSTLEYLDIN